MPRPKKSTKEAVSIINAETLIGQYLQDHKGDHYNFEEERSYTVSSGSLLLDIEMGGGIGPGIIRASGVAEGGKTSCALAFARNFQKMDNAMVVYVKSEGRLSKEMIERAGLDTDPRKWQIYKSNIFESVNDFMKHLVKNCKDTRFMFIVDSMDSLVLRNDLERPFDESDKVAGGSLITSVFLKKMALALTTRGHICFMISQVRATVNLNPYDRGDPKLTNASGGNALLHYSDWILEFQQKYKGDLIVQPSKIKDKKEDIIGHWCKVIFRKTPNEKTGSLVKYPICYGRKDGKSIWSEYEVVDMLLAFEMAQKSGAWVAMSDEIIKEVKENTGEELKKQHQGVDNLKKFFEENEKIGKYLFKKFRETLKR